MSIDVNFAFIRCCESFQIGLNRICVYVALSEQQAETHNCEFQIDQLLDGRGRLNVRVEVISIGQNNMVSISQVCTVNHSKQLKR